MIFLFANHSLISTVPLNTILPTQNLDKKSIAPTIITENIKTDIIEAQKPIPLPESFIPNIQNNFTSTPTQNVTLSSLIGISSHHFGAITSNYNIELTGFQENFSTIDKSIGTRSTGVSRAWKYEYSEVKMGGKGTGNFNSQQRQELLNNRRVRGAEGHHINNVSDHPELQADPNNIKMVADREAHLREHHGDFKNETSGPLFDRDARLIKTNKARVIRNELSGIGLAAAIGLGTGFTIGFITALAQTGMNPDSIKYAFVNGAKAGGESASLATGSAILGRTIGAVASKALRDTILTHMSGNIAGNMMENLAQMCNIGVVGSLTIIALSVYQFARLKQMGYSTKESLLRTGKSAALSASILILSIVAQGIWGGQIGIVISLVAGVIVTGYTLGKTIHNRKIFEQIMLYTIRRCCPIFE